MKLKNFFALGLLLAASSALADVAVSLKINDITLDTVTFVSGQTKTLASADGITATLTVTEGATSADFTLGFEKDGDTFSMDRTVTYGVALEEACPIHEFSISLNVAKVDATATTTVVAPAVEAASVTQG